MNPSNHPSLRALFGLAPLLATVTTAEAQGSNGHTTLESRDSTGQVASESSLGPSLSADGRYLAFMSLGALLPADTNGVEDVYVLDRETGVLSCASTTAGGTYGNLASFGPQLSANGRWVAFLSRATNFAALENGTFLDIFLKDLQTGSIQRISNVHLGAASGNEDSFSPSVSDDGRYVAFASLADNLVLGDTNLAADVFVYDTQTAQMRRVSEGVWGEANNNSWMPTISGDGQWVSFESHASNMVLWDTNGAPDVFVTELDKNPKLVSVNPAGNEGNDGSIHPSMSADATRVAFVSYADDLVAGDNNGAADVFVVDLGTLAVERASLGANQSELVASAYAAVLSRDGTAVAFEAHGAFAPLASGHTDVFVRDLELGRTILASLPTGVVTSANDDSFGIALDSSGDRIAFHSLADNLVPDDTNATFDVFVRSTLPDPLPYCTTTTTAFGCQPTLSSTGHPSPDPGLSFTILGDGLPNQKTGILFYGFQGRVSNPWGNGTMCVAGTKKRTPLTSTLGTPPGVDDCSGFLAFDMNAFARGDLGGSPKPALSLVGQQVNVQYWGRDPQATSGTFLSDALEYVVGP